MGMAPETDNSLPWPATSLAPAASALKPASTGTPSGRSLDSLLLAGLLAISVAAVFGRVVQFQFLSWDDDIHVTRNPLLDPASWANVLQFWVKPYENLYVPLSYTFFAAEAWLSELAIGRLDLASFIAVACCCTWLVCCWCSSCLRG